MQCSEKVIAEVSVVHAASILNVFVPVKGL
jgi:hypothetical protein